MTLQRFDHTGAAPSTTLASSMSPTDISFTTAAGTGYPTGAGGKLYVIAVDPGLPSEEKILCSARSGAVHTVSGGVAGRGYDGTTAQGHTAPTAVVEHVVAATEIDDDNDHIYTASRDDHTQYLRVDSTRAGTGTQTFNAVTATGNLAVGGTIVGSQTAQATALIATLTGTSARFIGRSTAAPSSGLHSAGDYTVDITGTFWVCSAAGTPGTWIPLGSPSVLSARAVRTTNFSVGASGWLSIQYDSAPSDPGSHMTLGAPAYYTATYPGRYLFTITAAMATNTAGAAVGLTKNNTGTLYSGVPTTISPLSGAGVTNLALSMVLPLVATDFVGPVIFNNTASSQNMLANTGAFTVDFLGP